VLRWVSPGLLGVLAISNVVLVFTTSNPLYTLALAGQVAFYLLAAVGAVLDRVDVSSPTITYVPYYYLVLNYSLSVALWNVLRNRNIVTWETETRSGSD